MSRGAKAAGALGAVGCVACCAAPALLAAGLIGSVLAAAVAAWLPWLSAALIFGSLVAFVVHDRRAKPTSCAGGADHDAEGACGCSGMAEADGPVAPAAPTLGR